MDDADAGLQQFLWRGAGHILALNLDAPVLDLGHPGQSVEQLTLAVPFDPGDAQHLAGVKVEADAVHGMKLARQDMFCVARLAELNDGEFAIYPVESFYLAVLATAPIVGTIGSMSNWIPEAFVGIKRNFEAGNLKRAAYLQRLACRLFAAFNYEEIPATKALLERRGVPCGESWDPLVPMTERDKKELYQAIDAFKVDFDSLAKAEEV